jgi:hypothetical protein
MFPRLSHPGIAYVRHLEDLMWPHIAQDAISPKGKNNVAALIALCRGRV